MRIVNLSGGMSISRMAQRVFYDDVPDVLAFSVLGWNFRSAGALAETFRQLNPHGLVIFGGTHVANQGARVFRLFPEVDIVANGEGEITFPNIIRRYLGDSDQNDFSEINGLSFRTKDGQTVNNLEQARVSDLELLPSPFLSGAIPMADSRGEFRYDVALMETNRGCPYSCAFCYWGGAIGQKIRKFSRDRLKEELEFFGRLKVPNIILCDSNFGMHKDDLTFVEDFIRTRERYGFPRTLDTSWAKNKSKVFYDIVRRMKQQGLRSSFTLALQTMTDTALETMNRKNMKINDWEDLLDWLGKEGMDCYVELIWGSPGDTYEEFINGYDDLARRTSRIAVYPLQVLPNTAYSHDRHRHGFITVRGDQDDFEYVLGHRGSSLQDNRRMQQFLFWARPVAEHMLFRHIWAPLRAFANLTQSMVLLRMASWFERVDDPTLDFLRNDGEIVVTADVVSRLVRHYYREKRMPGFFERWWEEDIVPLLPDAVRSIATEIFQFDQLTRPIFDEEGGSDGLTTVTLDGLDYYRRDVKGWIDVKTLCLKIAKGTWSSGDLTRRDTSLYYRVGFHMYVDSPEVAVHYLAKTGEEVALSAHGQQFEDNLSAGAISA